MYFFDFSDSFLSDPDGNSLASSIDRDLESVLAVYEGFCNLKQVTFSTKFRYFDDSFINFPPLFFYLVSFNLCF